MGNTNTSTTAIPTIPANRNNSKAFALEAKAASLSKEELFKKRILLEDWKATSVLTLRRSPYFKDLRIPIQNAEPFLPITRVLKSARRIRKLELQFNGIPKETLLLAWKHAIDIETLTLEFNGEHGHSLDFISTNLRAFKNLKSLKVILNTSTRWEEILQLSKLWSSMRVCRMLNEFRVECSSRAHLFNEEVIQNLFQTLKGLKKLDKFGISIRDPEALSHKEFSTFVKGIGQLSPLTELSITLRLPFPLPKEDLCTFCRILCNHQGLQKLHLDGFMDLIKLELFVLCLQQKTLLTSLRLKSRGFSVMIDQKLKSFVQKLQGLPNLKQFELDFFDDSNLTNSSFSALTSELMHLQNLKSFSFTIGEKWKIATSGLLSLSKCLDKLSSLVSLSLFLTFGDVRDSAITSIFLAIQKMQNLNSLSLTFDLGDDGFGDKIMIALASILPSLQQLSTFNLAFDNKKLTSKGTKALTDSLQSMRSLRELVLVFFEFATNTESLRAILTEIAKMRLLTLFALYFPHKEMNEGELRFVTETVRDLKNLKTIRLFLNVSAFFFLLRKVNQRNILGNLKLLPSPSIKLPRMSHYKQKIDFFHPLKIRSLVCDIE